MTEQEALAEADARVAGLWKLGIELDRMTDKQVMRKINDLNRERGPKYQEKSLSILYALYFRQAGLDFLVEAAKSGWNYRQFLDRLELRRKGAD